MHQQSADATPAVVSLPVEIDVTNAGQVYELLMAAAATGAPVVIADCTATVFCDAAGVRRLVMGHTQAAGRGVQLRLVIAPGGLLRRLLALLGADSVLPVYPGVEEASVPAVHPAQDPLPLPLHVHSVPRIRSPGPPRARVRAHGRPDTGNRAGQSGHPGGHRDGRPGPPAAP